MNILHEPRMQSYDRLLLLLRVLFSFYEFMCCTSVWWAESRLYACVPMNAHTQTRVARQHAGRREKQRIRQTVLSKPMLKSAFFFCSIFYTLKHASFCVTFYSRFCALLFRSERRMHSSFKPDFHVRFVCTRCVLDKCVDLNGFELQLLSRLIFNQLDAANV